MDYRDHPALAGYIDRIEAEQLNHRKFMKRIWSAAYYEEKALIRIQPDGSITCSHPEWAPTKEEAEAIKVEMANVEFPRSVPVSKTKAREVEKLRRDKGSILYPILDYSRQNVVMIQERTYNEAGEKWFVPWTYFSDGEWRMMEPDGLLPFWKPDRHPSAKGKARVMVHEGAKAAMAADAMVNDPDCDHPWIETLRLYEHWGLLGGALAPHRANYKELSDYNPLEVVYAPDNDYAGMRAVQEVSKQWGKAMKYIRYGRGWKEAWDMADPMPDAMFRGSRYVGPPLDKLMYPGTRATDQIYTGDRGRPTTVLKKAFCEEWVCSIKPEVYVHTLRPYQMLSADQFNNMVRPFSDVDNTARLIRANNAVKAAELKYDPSMPSGILTDPYGTYINTHVGTHIKPEPGDVSLWLDYMKNFIVRDDDRHEVMRWVATLLARPANKMFYGMLLVGPQGVGKSTLGEKVLRPLVGSLNVSIPSEADICNSDFNAWMAHKRLAIVHEIYAGGTSKAYDKLKSVITDRNITVNQKYMPAYEIDSWIHILACSNSVKPLQLANDDRRWLIPKVTDEVRPPDFWTALNDWLLDEGGLGKIMAWAHAFVEEHGAVRQGAPAPATDAKRSMIEEGYSEGMMFVVDFLRGLQEMGVDEDTFFIDVALVDVLRDVIHGGRTERLERPRTIRKVAESEGWFEGKNAVPVGLKWGQGGRSAARPVFLRKADRMRDPRELAKEGRHPIDVWEMVQRMGLARKEGGM